MQSGSRLGRRCIVALHACLMLVAIAGQGLAEQEPPGYPTEAGVPALPPGFASDPQFQTGPLVEFTTVTQEPSETELDLGSWRQLGETPIPYQEGDIVYQNPAAAPLLSAESTGQGNPDLEATWLPVVFSATVAIVLTVVGMLARRKGGERTTVGFSSRRWRPLRNGRGGQPVAPSK